MATADTTKRAPAAKKATATKRAGATKAKAQATTTPAEAAEASRSLREATQQAERTLRSLATDSAYVTVGIADNAVSYLRDWPNKVQELPKLVEGRAKTLLDETPKELQARLETVRSSAEKELEQYASRGRTVVEQIANAAPTKRAVEQARTALSSVKAARTNVRRAAGLSVEAVETGAEEVGA